MNHEEFKIHSAIVEHHATAFPHVTLMYVPNRVEDATEAYFNKVLGAQPGAHDLFLFWAWRNYGIFEVKSRTGRLSTAQNKFAGRIDRVGGKHGYGDSVRSYHMTLKSWGIEPKHDSIIEPDLRTKQQKFEDSLAFFRREDVIA